MSSALKKMQSVCPKKGSSFAICRLFWIPSHTVAIAYPSFKPQKNICKKFAVDAPRGLERAKRSFKNARTLPRSFEICSFKHFLKRLSYKPWNVVAGLENDDIFACPSKKKGFPPFFGTLFKCSLCCRCSCHAGYTGRNCESKYVPCEPSPCQNGGTCHQIDSLNYKCQCPKGMFSSKLT